MRQKWDEIDNQTAYEGYVYFAVEKAYSSSRIAGWGPIQHSPASAKL